MEKTWTDKWNERYASADYAYGEEPNKYLEEQLLQLPTGKILFPAEGEGRNAVFAAKLGWTVFAFDISIEGQKKARQLAERNNVVIDYQLGNLENLNYKKEQFDAIALIYAHFPAAIKSKMHKALDQYLRKGGTIIFEAFSKNHIHYIARNENVGGPRDIGSLFSFEEIRDDFNNYEFIELNEIEVDLKEGRYHRGQGSVIRFVARKK